MTEIEKKYYAVDRRKWKQTGACDLVEKGYLSSNVIRIETVKGVTSLTIQDINRKTHRIPLSAQQQEKLEKFPLETLVFSIELKNSKSFSLQARHRTLHHIPELIDTPISSKMGEALQRETKYRNISFLRYDYDYGDQHWVVEEYLKNFDGIMIAKTLTSPEETVVKPTWVQKELHHEILLKEYDLAKHRNPRIRPPFIRRPYL